VAPPNPRCWTAPGARPKRAKVIHRTIHALRHHALSTWIAAGLNVKVVQTMAGHASVTTTLNRYGHLFPDDLDLAAARLADMVAVVGTDAGQTRPVRTDEAGKVGNEKTPG
jgi:integrase